jgi:hypothetical protein
MRIKKQDELLDPVVRKTIITEIKQPENQWRKHEAYKRYQCYKDNTKRYVVENMLSQFDENTVIEMRYSISNISIAKKIVDKLSRVYANGVERAVTSDELATSNIKALEKALDFNSAMKTSNRFLKLQKNMALYIKPCPVEDDGDQKWTIKVQPLNPYLYDVVEDYYDRTKPLCFILSHYKPQKNVLLSIESGLQNTQTKLVTDGNNRDEKIADKPIDEGAGERELFVFWSDKYHFTCDASGEIVKDEFNQENINPFGICPLINFATDQDGSFWAQGGNDIADGAILLNAMMTHINHVGVTQGYGQAFMTGQSLPRSLKVGPTKVILGEYTKDEQAQPTFDFKSANPQLDSLRGLVEAYMALLLTTNNLSTSGISAQLKGASNSASGIALIIDKAESLEDVQDQRQVFMDKEPCIWQVIGKIIDVYNQNLTDDLQSLKLPENLDENLMLKFHDPEPIMTEKEKLENMKLRQELGIESMIGMLMKDDPNLDEAMAEEKLLKILEQEMNIKVQEKDMAQKLGLDIVTIEKGNPDNVGQDVITTSNSPAQQAENNLVVPNVSNQPTKGGQNG